MDEFIKHLEEMLKVDDGSLSPEFNLLDCDKWDSFAHVSFVVLAHEQYQKSVDAMTLLDCDTVSDLYKLVS